MAHSSSRWTRCVQVKLWDPLRMRAIPEHLRGVFTTRRYTNPRLPLPIFTLVFNGATTQGRIKPPKLPSTLVSDDLFFLLIFTHVRTNCSHILIYKFFWTAAVCATVNTALVRYGAGMRVPRWLEMFRLHLHTHTLTCHLAQQSHTCIIFSVSHCSTSRFSSAARLFSSSTRLTSSSCLFHSSCSCCWRASSAFFLLISSWACRSSSSLFWSCSCCHLYKSFQILWNTISLPAAS